MKKCSACGEEKEFDCYYKAGGRNGLRARCKQCTKKLEGDVRKPVVGYKVWHDIKRRCDIKTHKSFHNYGGRGITYAKKWETFAGFWEDMGPSYEKGLSIDRIDNNGNYCKENCRWVDMKTQIRNRRVSILHTINGVSKTLAEWGEDYGMKYEAVASRVFAGMPLEEALTKPRYSWSKARRIKQLGNQQKPRATP